MFKQVILPVIKNSVGLLLFLIAILGFIALLVPNYSENYGWTTALVAGGGVIGYLLALATVLYTKYTTTP